jgi:hypothetical protein
MVRQEWSLLGTVAGVTTGAAVFVPVLAQYGYGLYYNVSVSTLNYIIGVAASVAISLVITAIFYRVNIGSAQELLRKAEA